MKKIEKGFVIPIIISIVAVVAIVATVYFADHNRVEAPIVEVKESKTYRNQTYGFEFQYPASLTLTEGTDYVVLSHSVPYRYQDLCDMRDGEHWQDSFIDYSNKIRVMNSDYISAINKVYSWNPRGFVDINGDLKKGEIFSREFSVNGQMVYEYFMGVEGCGQYTYIIPSELKTVIVTNDLIPPFSFQSPYEGPFNKELIQKFRNLKGIIPPEQNNVVLLGILESFKFIPPDFVTPEPIACTMDAMMCPDGSYVGRSGPKCEFVCPK